MPAYLKLFDIAKTSYATLVSVKDQYQFLKSIKTDVECLKQTVQNKNLTTENSDSMLAWKIAQLANELLAASLSKEYDDQNARINLNTINNIDVYIEKAVELLTKANNIVTKGI